MILIGSLSIIPVCASDEADTSEALSDVTEPTTNIYNIIEGMWIYFLPENVIADNQQTIAFYTISLTVLFALAPFILIFKLLFRKR